MAQSPKKSPQKPISKTKLKIVKTAKRKLCLSNFSKFKSETDVPSRKQPTSVFGNDFATNPFARKLDKSPQKASEPINLPSPQKVSFSKTFSSPTKRANLHRNSLPQTIFSPIRASPRKRLKTLEAEFNQLSSKAECAQLPLDWSIKTQVQITVPRAGLTDLAISRQNTKAKAFSLNHADEFLNLNCDMPLISRLNRLTHY